MRINQGELASLWVKLDASEIQQRQICTRYNHFLFNEYPHPVLLWLIILYHHGHEPCWLPIYLDLKNPLGQRMTRLLIESGQYRLLFFSITEPQPCINVMTAIVPPAQRHLLKGWITRVPPNFSIGESKTSENRRKSKTMLKNALENLKPKIQIKLDSLYADSDFSG
jgi:eukaryotic-like serine/threonine-protein kinase